MLTVKQNELDLGTIQFGKVQNFEFEFTNTLPKDMVINKIQVSCTSCTVATMTKKIKGNQSATMKVQYTPGAVGLSNKWIDVVYDGDQVIRVKFKAVVNG